jgi:hypothetical protein
MTAVKQLTMAQLLGLSTSLPVYCANTVFFVAGQSLTTPQVLALISAISNASAASTAAKAAWVAARTAEEKSLAADGALVREVRDTVALMYSGATTTLSAFAIAPRKLAKPLTTEARAAATAKLRATRLARGTESKQKKALITGNVTGVTITPVTTGSAPSPAVVPAVAPTPAAPPSGAAGQTSTGATPATAAAPTHP